MSRTVQKINIVSRLLEVNLDSETIAKKEVNGTMMTNCLSPRDIQRMSRFFKCLGLVQHNTAKQQHGLAHKILCGE
jgi:hypothetical protein